MNRNVARVIALIIVIAMLVTTVGALVISSTQVNAPASKANGPPALKGFKNPGGRSK